MSKIITIGNDRYEVSTKQADTHRLNIEELIFDGDISYRDDVAMLRGSRMPRGYNHGMGYKILHLWLRRSGGWQKYW